MHGDEESSDEGFFDPSLFVNEEYITKQFDFGEGVKQSLLCSGAASTDHDLTGQIVWPVSVFSAFFAARSAQMFQGRNVVELGAGCGLTGLVASQFSARTALTDGNEVVLRVLEKNANMQQDQFPDQLVQSNELVWGDADSFCAFVRAFPHPVDVILGADVVCWPQLIRPLLDTLRALMVCRAACRSLEEEGGGDAAAAVSESSCAFYCGFVVRAENTSAEFHRRASALGFEVCEGRGLLGGGGETDEADATQDSEAAQQQQQQQQQQPVGARGSLAAELDTELFIPSPRPTAVVSSRELRLLRLRLRPEVLQGLTEDLVKGSNSGSSNSSEPAVALQCGGDGGRLLTIPEEVIRDMFFQEALPEFQVAY